MQRMRNNAAIFFLNTGSIGSRRLTMTFLKANAWILLYALAQRHRTSSFVIRPTFVGQLQRWSSMTTSIAAAGDNEAPVIPPMDGKSLDKSKYDDLLDWLRQRGAVVHPDLFVQESPRGGGCGAFVSKDVEEGTLLASIPRGACVTLDDAENDKCGEAFRDLMSKAGAGGETVVLAGYLAKAYLLWQERGKQGGPSAVDADVDSDSERFGPYLATLPWARGINNQEHILFWKSEDIESGLAGSFCYPEAKKLREEVELATKILNGIVGPSVRVARGELTDGFSWPWELAANREAVKETLEGLPEAVSGAFVCLLTRGFEDDYFAASANASEKLVPLLDMLQHSEEPNVSHQMKKDDGTVEVRARRNISAQEELLNQYRPEEEETMPYHRFFTRYGFVPGISEPVEHLLRDESSVFYPKVEAV